VVTMAQGRTRAREGAPLPATAAAVRTGRIAGATEKALAPASRPRSAMLATARIFRKARAEKSLRFSSLINAPHSYLTILNFTQLTSPTNDCFMSSDETSISANRCLRMTAETLSSLLFLSSIALTVPTSARACARAVYAPPRLLARLFPAVCT
jgi:hypothetical protein